VAIDVVEHGRIHRREPSRKEADAKRDTSMSSIITRLLEEFLRREDDYDRAMPEEMTRMKKGLQPPHQRTRRDPWSRRCGETTAVPSASRCSRSSS
jgi:hypothetical protein